MAKPTERQVKTFKKVVNEHKSVVTAMIESGYTKSTANNPQQLTRTEAWQQLLETHISDELLAKKHNELLEATDKDGNPDYNAIKNGVDMGYKLKGKYAPEKKINVNVDIETTEAELELAQQLLEQGRIKTNGSESQRTIPDTMD